MAQGNAFLNKMGGIGGGNVVSKGFTAYNAVTNPYTSLSVTVAGKYGAFALSRGKLIDGTGYRIIDMCPDAAETGVGMVEFTAAVGSSVVVNLASTPQTCYRANLMQFDIE